MCWIWHGSTWAGTAADKAAADALFLEGKKLITGGDTEAACPKFEASLAKLKQLGTQLALASCYEKLGKTASAWAAFRAAASTARKERDRRLPVAEKRVTELEARLSRLVIKLEPGYRVDGLVVRRDGEEVLSAELGSPLPVDPGDHTVEASAPGWVAWSTRVSVAPVPGHVEVIVPALGKAPVKVEEPEARPALPAERDASRPPLEPGRSQRHRRYLAYGLGGGGAALVGTALVLGAVASSRWSAAQPHCRDGVCDPTGYDLAGSAATLGNLSTGAFIAGAAAATAGVILFLKTRSATAEHRPAAGPAALHLAPEVGATQIGLSVRGGF